MRCSWFVARALVALTIQPKSRCPRYAVLWERSRLAFRWNCGGSERSGETAEAIFRHLLGW
jgi:hypothetical protein